MVVLKSLFVIKNAIDWYTISHILNEKFFIFIFDDVINFKGTRAILGWGLIEFFNFGLSSNTVPSFMLVSQSARFCKKRAVWPRTKWIYKVCKQCTRYCFSRLSHFLFMALFKKKRGQICFEIKHDTRKWITLTNSLEFKKVLCLY